MITNTPRQGDLLLGIFKTLPEGWTEVASVPGKIIAYSAKNGVVPDGVIAYRPSRPFTPDMIVGVYIHQGDRGGIILAGDEAEEEGPRFKTSRETDRDGAKYTRVEVR